MSGELNNGTREIERQVWNRQCRIVRRGGCLLLAYLSALTPVLIANLLGPSIWIFVAGLFGFLVVGMIIGTLVVPKLQRRFDDENRLNARYDPRDYVLLLRSFESRILKPKSRDFESGNLMREISRSVPRHFAVVCIGAGETIRGRMAPADYIALTPSNQDWFQVFARTAAGAHAVIITPDATPGCLEEMRAIASVSTVLARTLVWMPFAYHRGVAKAWMQTRSFLHGRFELPEYDKQGVLYRPNAEFSPALQWHPGKHELEAVLGLILGETLQRGCSLGEALAKLDRKGLKC